MMPSSRIRNQFLGAVAVVAVAASSTPAAAAPYCANAREHMALTARVLQTELVVAALACGQKAEYNAFVNRFKTVLVERGGNLKSYFRRSYGGAANRHLDALITDLANRASQRNNEHSGLFCAGAAKLFTALADVGGAPAQALDVVAHELPNAGDHGVEPCEIRTASLPPVKPIRDLETIE